MLFIETVSLVILNVIKMSCYKNVQEKNGKNWNT